MPGWNARQVTPCEMPPHWGRIPRDGKETCWVRLGTVMRAPTCQKAPYGEPIAPSGPGKCLQNTTHGHHLSTKQICGIRDSR